MNWAGRPETFLSSCFRTERGRSGLPRTLESRPGGGKAWPAGGQALLILAGAFVLMGITVTHTAGQVEPAKPENKQRPVMGHSHPDLHPHSPPLHTTSGSCWADHLAGPSH